MKEEFRTHLHCGACKEKFNTPKELSEHLDKCTAAEVGRLMCKRFMDEEIQKILDADPEEIKARHEEEKPQ